MVCCLAMLLAAAPAVAHPPAHGEAEPVDSRPAFQKDWEARMERSLTIHPEPWEMVWPKAWNGLVRDGDPPLTTAQVHAAITRIAWSAYGALNFEVLRLEEEDRAAQAACAETVARTPDLEPSCAVPCRGSCPAKLTAAEEASMRRRARIDMARRKMAQLDELARVSQARLAWKREQGEDVDKPTR